MKISATILTHNSEATIGKTLHSIRDLLDELIIVDDESKDTTLDIVRSICPGAKILHRKLDNFAQQRNFSLSHCTSDWILIIDSDEFLSEELKAAIRSEIAKPRSDIFICMRLNRNLAGWGKAKMDRPILIRKGLEFVNPLHETVVGEKKMLSGNLYHDCWTNIHDWAEDMQIYSAWKARNWAADDPNRSILFLTFRQFAAAGYLFLKRFFAEKRYKQGLGGFLYCFTWSFEEFLVLLKYYELTHKNEK